MNNLNFREICDSLLHSCLCGNIEHTEKSFVSWFNKLWRYWRSSQSKRMFRETINPPGTTERKTV